ncbi:MAG: T9SS type A sorting domain-containing protein [Candidatus Hydrothermia bacterium]
MKKLLLTVFLLICTASMWAQGQNLIINPGFEMWDTSSTGVDSIPTAWHFYTKSAQCSGYVEKVEGYDGFGAKLVIAGDTSGYDATFYHYINGIDTLPFANDTFIVCIKAQENSGGIGGRIYSYWQDSEGGIVGGAVSTAYTTNSPDWQEIYVKTVRPATNAVTFKFDFRIYKYAASEDFIIIDDAYFGPLTLLTVPEQRSVVAKLPSMVGNVLSMDISLKEPSHVRITLYTPDGRCIKNLYEDNISGVNNLNFDISQLKKGVYFVVVDTKETRLSYRVLKY